MSIYDFSDKEKKYIINGLFYGIWAFNIIAAFCLIISCSITTTPSTTISADGYSGYGVSNIQCKYTWRSTKHDWTGEILLPCGIPVGTKGQDNGAPYVTTSEGESLNK